MDFDFFFFFLIIYVAFFHMYIVCHAWYGPASEPRGAWAQCIGAAHCGAVRCVSAALPRAR